MLKIARLAAAVLCSAALLERRRRPPRPRTDCCSLSSRSLQAPALLGDLGLDPRRRIQNLIGAIGRIGAFQRENHSHATQTHYLPFNPLPFAFDQSVAVPLKSGFPPKSCARSSALQQQVWGMARTKTAAPKQNIAGNTRDSRTNRRSISTLLPLLKFAQPFSGEPRRFRDCGPGCSGKGRANHSAGLADARSFAGDFPPHFADNCTTN